MYNCCWSWSWSGSWTAERCVCFLTMRISRWRRSVGISEYSNSRQEASWLIIKAKQVYTLHTYTSESIWWCVSKRAFPACLISRGKLLFILEFYHYFFAAHLLFRCFARTLISMLRTADFNGLSNTIESLQRSVAVLSDRLHLVHAAQLWNKLLVQLDI